MSASLCRLFFGGPCAAHSLSPLCSVLSRLEYFSDFTLPLYWDNMAAGEAMKVVTLQHSTAEYRTVEKAFKKTSYKSVKKASAVP